MWETSMEGLLSLIRKTTPSSFTYICEKNGGSLSDKVALFWPNISFSFWRNFSICILKCLSFQYLQMDELACFAPGMLALGSSGYGPEKAEKILSLAEEVYFWSSW